MDIKKIVNNPIFFNRNRVGRIYTGGKLFSGFFGDEPVDNFLPEEWVCSTVDALNEGSDIKNEGLSTVKGTDILFRDLLRDYKKEMLGDLKEFSVLVKLLDSSVRLPVQAHPDSEYSQKYLNSTFGKAESWVIVDTRENACIYFGFKNKLSKEEFREAVRRSEAEPEYMTPMLNRIPVKKGDVFLIPAKMVHAIGAGCLILETQEPTDFTIQPEHWCAGLKISEHTMYLGLPEDIAMDVFDYDLFGDAAIAKGRKYPHTVSDENGVKFEELISYDDTPCFAVNRITVNNSDASKLTTPAIYIITEGEGTVVCGENTTPVHKGDYFFAPHSIDKNFRICSDGVLEITQCLPSIR